MSLTTSSTFLATGFSSIFAWTAPAALATSLALSATAFLILSVLIAGMVGKSPEILKFYAKIYSNGYVK